MRRVFVVLTAMCLLFGVSRPLLAQSADELAKQTQNPVASLISVPFQGNWDFGIGDREATGTTLNIQPVAPFGLTKEWNVILRVIMPVQSQPADGGQRLTGMGDTTMTLFLSPAKTGKVIWGAGPAILIPTATNVGLGTEKFGLGPSVVALMQPGKWTVGALWNQIWSMDGANDRADVNQMFLQPFANYNLGEGMALGAQMEAFGQLGSRQRPVDDVPDLFDQQGDAARQAPSEFRSGSGTRPRKSDRPARLEAAVRRDVPVPALNAHDLTPPSPVRRRRASMMSLSSPSRYNTSPAASFSSAGGDVV